ncbi:unnamed protein product [Phaeothamnion confervicola]
MGDTGLTLRGIPARTPVGYLSHLEALRYCQVGDFLKSPLDPVWVVGSTSHFTVLFGVDRAATVESASEKLLEAVQRAFKAADTREAGFIEVSQLRDVLVTLLPELAADGADGNGNGNNGGGGVNSGGGRIGALASKLEMPGSGGLIIWSDFWQAVSRLMTGTSLEAVLTDGWDASSGGGGGMAASDGGAFAGASSGGGGSGSGSARPRSDSDVARELQAQFDSAQGTEAGAEALMALSQGGGGASGGGFGSGSSGGGFGGGGGSSSGGWDGAAAAAAAASPGDGGGRPRSDSDVARELQASFDQEAGGSNDDSRSRAIVGAASGGWQQMPTAASTAGGGGSYSSPSSGVAALSTASAMATATPSPHPSPNVRSGIHRHDSIAGDSDPSFVLFHYNGLTTGSRRPQLTRFVLTRRSASDAVGMSVALGGADTNSGAAYACPAEAVLRTKWPGARVDWLGQRPPNID